jgi:hypothetical protein
MKTDGKGAEAAMEEGKKNGVSTKMPMGAKDDDVHK